MTALIGYCFKDGAFLVADTQRLIETKFPDGNSTMVSAKALKINKLNQNIGIASAGNPSDEARFRLQVNIKPEHSKEQISNMVAEYYGELLKTNRDAHANHILFGVDEGKGFIQHFIWENEQYTVRNYEGEQIIIAEGENPNQFKDLAERCLVLSSLSQIKGYQLDYWAQLVMHHIVNHTGKKEYIELYKENPVAFPIDLLIFKNGGISYYSRRFKLDNKIEEKLKTKISPNIFTVQ
ncbi:hypothetical protein [Paenibacillus sp. LHD-38]|uniref:hypothetical protein n=1 Tax=Paenibacillus sp. LHD-38 TaxID=3072143 RepID=UPI00280EEB5D|nr:hypothetical protein [Paenibacillus sp. LHD-38]MDQ8734251.1 hypothetical protein [Paenibacillus sp. LHD-38]